MRTSKAFILALILLAVSALTAIAAAITDRSAFSGDETVITFDGRAHDEMITTQYTGDGVTFTGIARVQHGYGSFGWPGSGSPVVVNYPGTCPCDNTLVATFEKLVAVAGADFATRPDDDLSLEAYREGVLVDSATFSTSLSPAFAGLDVAGGFDELRIVPIKSSVGAFIMDDFTFEFADTKGSLLSDSGVPGKGLETAPGQQKEFNPNSQAGEHAGKK